MKIKKESKIRLEKFTVAKIARSSMPMINGGSSIPSHIVTQMSDNREKTSPGIDGEP